MTDANTPLTEDELDQLSEFLDDLPSPDAMNIERLDGFFCALIAGPDLILPSEYWPKVIGATTADQQPSFKTLQEAQEIMDLLVRHWNAIAQTLAAGEIYLPILLLEESVATRGKNWAKGFLAGVDMRRGSWERLVSNDEGASLIFPMLALAHENHPDPKLRFESPPPEQREELLHFMTAHLVKTYRFFQDERGPGPLPVPQPIARGAPRVGRNDLCPCGSGRKHKRCCMLTLH